MISSWEDYFTKSSFMDYSNSHLKAIRDSMNPSANFIDSIQEISKKPGITLLALDAS
jgi:hypothetical protein